MLELMLAASELVESLWLQCSLALNFTPPILGIMSCYQFLTLPYSQTTCVANALVINSWMLLSHQLWSRNHNGYVLITQQANTQTNHKLGVRTQSLTCQTRMDLEWYMFKGTLFAVWRSEEIEYFTNNPAHRHQHFMTWLCGTTF